jgi:menaquinol-cytochrome c reductase iron-sulfur subunit
MNPSPQHSGTPDRRGFLAVALAAAACAVPALVGLFSFLNPCRKFLNPWHGDDAAPGSAGKFIRVASLAELKDGAPPKRFSVVSERRDAWTHSVEPVGTVFLRRTGADQVLALQVKCPHEGCPVKFNDKTGAFACTCHTARFDADGKRIDPDTSMSPRDLDTLAVEIRDQQVWVNYEEYAMGTPEKIART